MDPSLEKSQASAQDTSSKQNRLIIVLADISGYTNLMLANQTSALHGQIVVSMLIESILKEVDIPLQLQEIEGDAVFLYAEHPGSDAQWQEVCEHVGRKLPRFFEAFAEATIAVKESTVCRCAVCQDDDLRLKIVVHTGEAVFHSISGRAQVSGVDVIQAHRLLKNSIPSNEYILLTEAAHEHLGPSLDLGLTEGKEAYEGLGSIRTFVHFPGNQEGVRRKFYAQSAGTTRLERCAIRGLGDRREFQGALPTPAPPRRGRQHASPHRLCDRHGFGHAADLPGARCDDTHSADASPRASELTTLPLFIDSAHLSEALSASRSGLNTAGGGVALGHRPTHSTMLCG